MQANSRFDAFFESNIGSLKFKLPLIPRKAHKKWVSDSFSPLILLAKNNGKLPPP